MAEDSAFKIELYGELIIEAWRIDYNASRPYSALGYATPQEFASSLQGHAPGAMTSSAQAGQTQQHELST